MGVPAGEREGRRVPQGARAVSGPVFSQGAAPPRSMGAKGRNCPAYPLSGTARYSRQRVTRIFARNSGGTVGFFQLIPLSV